MEVEELLRLFVNVGQIALSKVENRKELEELYMRTINLFLTFEDPFEIDEFDILTILGNVGG